MECIWAQCNGIAKNKVADSQQETQLGEPPM